MLPGVFSATKKDGTIYYRASLTYKTKHISLGSFSTMEEAHAAYLQAGYVMNDKTLTMDSYHNDIILSTNNSKEDFL